MYESYFDYEVNCFGGFLDKLKEIYFNGLGSQKVKVDWSDTDNVYEEIKKCDFYVSVFCGEIFEKVKKLEKIESQIRTQDYKTLLKQNNFLIKTAAKKAQDWNFMMRNLKEKQEQLERLMIDLKMVDDALKINSTQIVRIRDRIREEKI